MNPPDEACSEQNPGNSDYVTGRKFVDFPLSRELLQGIHDHGYVDATPIQAAAIEPALAGRDLLARAKTGTGKTAAFCIPIIERIGANSGKPQAIILAPTRELAQQIAEEVDLLVAHMDITTAVLVGGMPMGPQLRDIDGGASIIVGTPGRVLDHIGRGTLDTTSVQVACLDEADEMVSMGFYEQVTKILKATPNGRQVLLFSATISQQTGRLVRQFLNDPEDIILSTDEDKVEGITHVSYEAPRTLHKARALMYILDLENPEAAIVFCNTREDTSTVASFLDKQGHDVMLLSGELPQSRRYEVMKKVKAGAVRILVATDVASRGIDISGLSHVFNYSLPHDAKVYLHRIGRTGRIGKKGTAISLLSGRDIATRKILESLHKIKFERRPFPPESEAVAVRVERDAAKIRKAMGSMVFESHLPAARAIMKRPDAELLIAVALRGFFNWDRQRLAALSDVQVPEQNEQGSDDRGANEDRGRGRGKKRDDRGARDDRKPRGRRDDDAMTDDLDALLLSDSDDLDDLLAESPTEAKAANGKPSDDSSAEGDEEPTKKRRKRRRKRKKTADQTEESSDTPSDEQAATPAPQQAEVAVDLDAALVADEPADSDDLDALLSSDDDGGDLDALLSSDDGDDLDALLSSD